MAYTDTKKGGPIDMSENFWSGERLKALRERAGLSQPQLAAAAELPLTTLRNWEQGRREPLASAIVRLAKALGVSADVLLGLAPMPSAGEAEASAPTRPKGTTGKGKGRK
jgi:transcriptional regulator with XRE-family HTH domain